MEKKISAGWAKLIRCDETAEIIATGAWADAHAQAKELVSKMTLEEKVSLTGGTNGVDNGCSGNIANISRVGFPGMCLSDAGHGLRATDFVSSFPSGIHVGARCVDPISNSVTSFHNFFFRILT